MKELKKMKVLHTLLFLFQLSFLWWTLTINRTAWKGIRKTFFFLSPTSTRPQTFRKCFCNFATYMATLQFNRSACYNQTVITRLFLNEIYPPLELPFDWFDWLHLLHLLDITLDLLTRSEFEFAQVLQATPIRYLTWSYKFFRRW